MRVTSLLTKTGPAVARAWRSLRTTRQRIEAGVAFVAAVACIIAAAVQVGPAFAETRIEGRPVPGTMLASIVLGTTSCPALTGPRLAAQLMAASEFEATAVSPTGEGLAGMNAEEWKQWAPWPQAQRSDARANVLALAHQTCELIGRMRLAGVDADHWEAAVAAERVGAEAVTGAKKIPDSAAEHVDLVAGYANWYADEPQFADGGVEAAAATSAPAGATVPAEYLGAVREAGQICPMAVSPARIAAQLMALSTFNPNLRGEGRHGIAQLTDEMWQQYAPSRTASIWDPQASITALGTAMCDLNNQLSGIQLKGVDQADSYTLALAAFQWGMNAVRAEGGVPRNAAVPQLADQVDSFLPKYSADTRLEIPEPSAPPQATATAAPSASPSAGPSSSASSSPSPDKVSPSASAPVWDPAVSYQFVNALNGRVIEVPGTDKVFASGTTMQLWENLKQKDQYWRIKPAADAAYLTITNAHTGKALGVRNGSTDNHTEVVMLNPAPTDHNQQWQLIDGGVGYFVVNRKSGKVLDIYGEDCCAGNGASIQQYERRDRAVDQRWKITR